MLMSLGNNIVLGVYGDGQLAHMLSEVAIHKNIETVFLTLDPDNSPCQEKGLLIKASSWSDELSFKNLMDACTVLVLENEFIPPAFLKLAHDRGRFTLPDAHSFEALSDKLKQVKLAESLNINVPAYNVIHTPEDLERLPLPVMLKSLRGGYDGYGNYLDALAKFV